MPDAARPPKDWTARLGSLVFELAFLGAVYFFLVREPVLIGGIGVALIASTFVPQRLASLVGGLVVVGVGTVDHFASGRTQIPAALCVIGGLIASFGVFTLVAARRGRSD